MNEVNDLELYEVDLLNQQTGETRGLTIMDTHPAEAQRKALEHAFTEWGWHSVKASVPVAA